MLVHERTKLLFGPYRMPRCRVGGFLTCARRGEVRVTGITDAPIQWPHTQRHESDPRPSIILCRDLLRAIRKESRIALAYHFGITGQTVSVWRRLLGVPGQNEGTLELHRRHGYETMTPELLAKLAATKRNPGRLAKISAAHKGMRHTRKTKEAISKANKGRKHNAEARRKMSLEQKARWRGPDRPEVAWTKEEEGLPGTVPDKDVAARLGRTVNAVHVHRLRLGIPSFYKRKWRGDSPRSTPRKDALLGTMPDVALARQLGCTPTARTRLDLSLQAFNRPLIPAEWRSIVGFCMRRARSWRSGRRSPARD